MKAVATHGFWHWLAGDEVKASILTVSSLLLFSCFVGALFLFRPADAQPNVLLIDMDMRKEIRAFASVVKTGLYVKNFEVFDITQDHFIAGVIVWFEFLSDEVMIDTVQNFSFVNTKILEKSQPDIRVDGNRVFVKFDVKVEFKSELNYHRYPFDDHRISLVMTNTAVTPREMYFTVENSSFAISADAYTANWRILGLDTAWGYTNLALDSRDKDKDMPRPVVAYSINLAKSAIRNVIIIFIPLFIALLFAFVTFLSPLTAIGERSKSSIAGLTALLSYRFVIDRMIPSVSYLTTTDLIYILFLLLTLLIFLLQILLGTCASFLAAGMDYRGTILRRFHDSMFVVCSLTMVAGSAWILLR